MQMTKSIDDLPDQILGGLIFRQCPKTSLESIRKVSQKWDQLVDRYTGRTLIIKSGKEFIVDSKSILDKLSIKGNFWLTLAYPHTATPSEASRQESRDEVEPTTTSSRDSISITLPKEENKEHFPEIPETESVRKLGIIGRLSCTPFELENIVKPCTNLTGLYIHMSVFNGIPVSKVKDIEAWSSNAVLPHLKELVIDCNGINEEESSELFHYRRIFIAIVGFLQSQKYPHLQKLICGVPYVKRWEGMMVWAICNFLGKHAETVKSFSYNQRYEDSDDEDTTDEEDEEDEQVENVAASAPTPPGEAPEEGKKPETGEGDCKDKSPVSFPISSKVNYLSLSQLAMNAKELKPVQLEEFHVVLIRNQDSAPLWKNLLIQQNGMRKCIFVGDKMPCPLKTIEVNAKTLVTLRLDIRDGVNLGCFQYCDHLKNLTLHGSRDQYQEKENDEDDPYEQPLQLTNAKWLPLSLESIEVINLITHKDDARIIALELPNLRELALKNVGWEGNHGLRLSDLVEVWKIRKLNHLCIQSSLNLASYTEMNEEAENISPELNLLLCVVQSNSFAAASRFYLNVEKNEFGLYMAKSENFSYSAEMEDTDVFSVPNHVYLKEEDDDDDDDEESGEDEETSRRSCSGSDEEPDETDEWQDCEDESEEDGDGKVEVPEKHSDEDEEQ